jgi:hypothetical protein
MDAAPPDLLDQAAPATLDAVLAVLLPSTSGPGAVEAGAIEYVLRRIAAETPVARQQLCRWLDEAAADPAEAVARLALSESDDDAALFARLRAWAWEGFLGDPSYGGNRGQIGWRRFGHPGPPKAGGYAMAESGPPLR